MPKQSAPYWSPILVRRFGSRSTKAVLQNPGGASAEVQGELFFSERYSSGFLNCLEWRHVSIKTAGSVEAESDREISSCL